MTAEFNLFHGDGTLASEEPVEQAGDSALGILQYLTHYVTNDPTPEPVSWDELFDEPKEHPVYAAQFVAEEKQSIKSVRDIAIDDKHTIHVEAIVLEEEARLPAHDEDPDQRPSMMFRLTLTEKAAKGDRNVVGRMLSRVIIDLGEDGARAVDNNDASKQYEVRITRPEDRDIISNLSGRKDAHPLLAVFTSPTASLYRGHLSPDPVLTVAHLREIKSVFHPRPVAPVNKG